MAAELDVLAIGNINTDISFYAEDLPEPDKEVIARDYSIFQGGSAANFSVAASKLGLKAGMLGCVGDDIFGRDAIKSLQAEGVCTDFVRVSKEKRTGVVCVLVNRNCERSMVAFRGANLELENLVEGQMPKARITELSNVSRKILKEVLGRKEGFISLDPGGESGALKPDDLKGLDLLLLNEGECACITGEKFEKGAETLLGSVKMVIVKLGAGGAFLRRRGMKAVMPAFKVNVLDTTGAGDAFDAGVIAALSYGKDPKEALVWGSGTAALKIQKKGARNGLPTKNVLMKFLSIHNK